MNRRVTVAKVTCFQERVASRALPKEVFYAQNHVNKRVRRGSVVWNNIAKLIEGRAGLEEIYHTCFDTSA